MPRSPAGLPSQQVIGLTSEANRLSRAFGRVLAVTLVMPPGVIACSHTRSSSKADAGTEEPADGSLSDVPLDACIPRLEKVFFGTVNNTAECRATQSLACGLPSRVHVLDGGCAIKASDCREVCPSYGAFNCQAADASCVGGQIRRDGPISVSCDFCPGGIGRRPVNLVAPPRRESAGAVAAYFEHAAFLEAASVRAFGELAVDLAACDAPPALFVEARRAARDELRHLRMTARLARRFGGRAPPSARAVGSPTRRWPTLASVARENAVEGCVRETYGALVAHYQAMHASDAVVRRTMSTIADDETRHAALSWSVFHFTAARLKKGSRAVVSARLASAIDALHREVEEPDAELVRVAGLPTAVEQRRLLAQMKKYVWS
ncbi:MAG TPA: ferritin-like domain-containing protein [Polyangiaceae bacterium]|nr:ferritin-like domain-containing protein [Polyangiaceae bacterium]